MSFLDQLASTVSEMPPLSFEDIHVELSQLHDHGFFSQQLTDFIEYQYSPYSTSTYSASSPDYTYQPYSPQPLTVKHEPIWSDQSPPKQWSPKMRNARIRATGSADMTNENIDAIRVAFKLKRIKLGLSQKQAAASVSEMVRKTSQTSLCRFENNQLHMKNMKSLAPHLKKWCDMN